uniref:Uncharacterized protein n=1 Tax=Anopheles albimanus TaxID=7167 RepID=A0A182F7W3_ANOAL
MWEMQALNSQNASSNLTTAHETNGLNGNGCGTNGLATNGISISSSGSSCSTASNGSTTNGSLGPNSAAAATSVGVLTNGNGVLGAGSGGAVVQNGVGGGGGLGGAGSNASVTVGVGSGADLNGNGTQSQSVTAASAATISDLQQHVTNSLTVTLPTSDLEAQTLAFVESANAFLHPALRGVKAVSLARKRPLLGGPRSTMNPTKRTVMTLIARARTAQALHGSRTAQPIGEPIQVITSPLILQPPLDLLQSNAPGTGVTKENILQGA